MRAPSSKSRRRAETTRRPPNPPRAATRRLVAPHTHPSRGGPPRPRPSRTTRGVARARRARAAMRPGRPLRRSGAYRAASATRDRYARLGGTVEPATHTPPTTERSERGRGGEAKPSGDGGGLRPTKRVNCDGGARRDKKENRCGLREPRTEIDAPRQRGGARFRNWRALAGASRARSAARTDAGWQASRGQGGAIPSSPTTKRKAGHRARLIYLWSAGVSPAPQTDGGPEEARVPNSYFTTSVPFIPTAKCAGKEQRNGYSPAAGTVIVNSPDFRGPSRSMLAIT